MKNLPRYFLVGSCAASFDLVFFLVFSTWLGINYMFVGAVGFILATFVNYALSIRWVFESGSRFCRHREIVAVYLVSLVGLGMHSLILFISVSKMGLVGIVGKILATGLVFLWNYSARHYYVFRGRD